MRIVVSWYKTLAVTAAAATLALAACNGHESNLPVTSPNGGTSTAGTIKSDNAVSFGLIITELVINSLKHGFPDGRKGQICVDFAAAGPDWRLCVSDNGIGRPPAAPARSGLGTRIIESVAQHLKATVEIVNPCSGAKTIISHIGEA